MVLGLGQLGNEHLEGFSFPWLVRGYAPSEVGHLASLTDFFIDLPVFGGVSVKIENIVGQKCIYYT